MTGKSQTSTTIWQWLLLSKWTSEYERYVELQKKMDEKLDLENGSDPA